MHISPNNKKYIGITCQKPNKRWKNGKGYEGNDYFYKAINKYGWDNFQHIIIAKGLDEETAKWLEIELIREWNTTDREKGYNITLGGEGTNGYRHTKETKKKIGRKNSDENHPKARKIVLLNTEEVFLTIKEAAEKYNAPPQDIVYCCRGKLKSSGKLNNIPLVWKYFDEYIQLTKEEIKKIINDVDTRIICVTTNEIFFTAKEAGEKYNIDDSSIIKCCKGKLKSRGIHPVTHKKLIWKYYKDIINSNEWEVYEE